MLTIAVLVIIVILIFIAVGARGSKKHPDLTEGMLWIAGILAFFYGLIGSLIATDLGPQQPDDGKINGVLNHCVYAVKEQPRDWFWPGFAPDVRDSTDVKCWELSTDD